MKKLFLLDAYAIIFRSYYAFMRHPMHNAEGLNTSAIFGFTKFLKDIISREKPHYLGVAFDPKGGNFRHELFEDYKANRAETPEDIIASVPYIKQILEAMRIPILEVSGYEADDVIGTLAQKAAQEGFEVFMVTPDKDFGQLVGPHTFIYRQGKQDDGIEIVGVEQIKKAYGISDPRHIIDILALWGDASDNIPGAQGIGEKGASKLIGEWGTVENLFDNLNSIKGKHRENIEASRDKILLSKRLATIVTDVPIEFCPDRLIVEEPDRRALREIYRTLGFNMFLRALDAGKAREESKPAAQPQATLFSGEPMQPSLFSGESTQPTLFDAPASQGDLFEQNIYDNISTTEHKYHTVGDAEALRRLVEMIGRYPEFCFDTETTGIDVFNDRIVGISFAVEPHRAFYVPFELSNSAEYAAILKPLFANPEIAKTGQNIKFDIMVLAQLGIEVAGFKYDTMLLHYLLDPESRHNMGYLARTYLNYEPIPIESLIGHGARQITMEMVAPERVAEYAAEDADVTLQLKHKLWPLVVEQGVEMLYRTIEEPLIAVLADIEMTGVKIDTAMLRDYGSELNLKLASIEEAIRREADQKHLNINSARQLGKVLFESLKIDPKPKMTKTKQYCTDEEYLQTLVATHPIVPMILEYRGVKKLLSTYVETLPLLINNKTGHVHTSFNQAVTATGRLSSTNPNLQNIPIRDDIGRQIRKAFVPSRDDRVLLSTDYSQVELRLMAHLSGDPAMIEAFGLGEDIHAATAAKIFGVTLSEVTSDQRRKAKTANFGIIYGISAFGLSQRLTISRHEAKEIIDSYFTSYPGVKRYMQTVVEKARERGYVETVFGRKRYLPNIRSTNANVRGLAERNAINAPIQGSAADIMKLGMIAAHRGLKEADLESKIILQVHDELVIDAPKNEIEEVVRIIVAAMESAAALSVHLVVDYGTGKSWFEAH